jgi:hypothetical protein
MTGGCPPVVAIEEAMHYAERIGFSVIVVNAAWAPFRFHGHQRRTDHACPGQETSVKGATDCQTSWHPAPRRSWNFGSHAGSREDTGRELWVRGPDRHWHPYAIYTDRIEIMEIFGMSKSEHLDQQTPPVG